MYATFDAATRRYLAAYTAATRTAVWTSDPARALKWASQAMVFYTAAHFPDRALMDIHAIRVA